MSILFDKFQRSFSYLRLSVTNNCNFKCQYCLPEGQQILPATSFITLDEIRRLVLGFSALGIKKIRLTGGEPTIRSDFTEIIKVIHENSKESKIAVTTNGTRLLKDVHKWKENGLTALNVSLDSLDPRQFHLITGKNKHALIMEGIEHALQIGISTVKINVVLMKNMTDELRHYLNWIKERPLQLRFIELMETGQGKAFFEQHHLSAEPIKAQLLAEGWQIKIPEKDAGPALVFHHPDYLGEIGLIMPYAASFCESCNRLRVSSEGKLHLCLFGEEGISLRDLLQDDAQQDELKQNIMLALQQKRKSHYLQDGNAGITDNLAFIGG